MQRLVSIFLQRGFRKDFIYAVINTKEEDIFLLYKRVSSLEEYQNSSSFEDMLISFKRMQNILKEAKEKGVYPQKDLFSFSWEDPYEKKMYDFYKELKEVSLEDPISLYDLLAKKKPVVDSFFDHVLVMDKDPDVRERRLSLLKGIVDTLKKYINPSYISR